MPSFSRMPRAFQKGRLVLNGSCRQQDPSNRDVDTLLRAGFEEGLLKIIAQTSDFTGRGHLDAKRRIGTVRAA